MGRAWLRSIALTAACAAASLGAHGALLGGARRAAPRAPDVLAAEAALGGGGEPGGLGASLLRTEFGARRAELDEALGRWSARKGAYARIGRAPHLSPPERARRLVAELFERDHAGAYVRESSTLGRLLFGPDAGGNCEAETKLVLAALDASLALEGAGVAAGVQVFDDHVQAVVIDLASGKVWAPLTGEEQPRAVAPVYRPEILFHAFLVGRGEAPKVSAGALLLAAAPGGGGAGGGAGFETDSRLRFPAAGVRYRRGAPPARATLAPPGPGDGDGARVVQKTDVVPRPLAPREDALAYEACPSLAVSLLTIRDPRDAAFFNLLPTLETRASFLVELAERAIARADLDGGEALATLFERGDAGGLARRLGALRGVLGAVECTDGALGALAIASRVYAGRPFGADDRGPLAPFALEAAALPRVARARAEVSALSRSAGLRPRRFAERLAALPHSVRAELLALLSAYGEGFARGAPALLAVLRAAPGRADLPDEVPAPKGEPAEWVSVELADAPGPAAAAGPPLGQGPAPPAPPSAAGEGAEAEGGGEGLGPLRVAPDIVIDVAAFAIASRPEALALGPPAALRAQWTRAVDRRFGERRAAAPRRERAYFDAMAMLLAKSRVF